MRNSIKVVLILLLMNSYAYGQSGGPQFFFERNSEIEIFAVIDTRHKADGILILDDLALRFAVGAKVYGKDNKPITTYALKNGQKVAYKIQSIRGVEYIKEVRVLPDTAKREDYATY